MNNVKFHTLSLAAYLYFSVLEKENGIDKSVSSEVLVKVSIFTY